jgi:ribonucleoside-diphosphate reductase alpha chain
MTGSMTAMRGSAPRQDARITPHARRRTATGWSIWEHAMTATINRRESLPPTRKSITHKFSINQFEGYLTVGLFEDGRPGEVFIKMSKEGSTLSGLVQGFCRAFSLALQHGLTVRDACDRFRGMHFEPAGPTNNPEIPEASSILDYVARYLELNHCGMRAAA